MIERDITPNPKQLEPLGSDFVAVAIPQRGHCVNAIAGSWKNLVNFDPGSFEFTDEDSAELSELFAEIEAEEAGA